MLVFEESTFGIGGRTKMLGIPSHEIASMAKLNNRRAVPVHGWPQNDDSGWSSVPFAWSLIA
eukprot:3649519-Lingulodinium_polyedra.AAC.1